MSRYAVGSLCHDMIFDLLPLPITRYLNPKSLQASNVLLQYNISSRRPSRLYHYKRRESSNLITICIFAQYEINTEDY